MAASPSSLGCSAVSHLVRVERGSGCGAREAATRPTSLTAPFGVVGLNHRTAPLTVRSRVGVSPDAVPEFLAAAREFGLAECAVLSTCNRTELYFSGGEMDEVAAFLAHQAGIPVEELRPHLYEKHCVCAACHLFRVAAGLDSAVLGETEIVAQVKEAWRAATEAGTAGPMIDLLFQRSLESSKRIRTETDLCRTVTSTGSLAVRTVQARLGDLTDRRLVVLGAGKIADRILKDLRVLGARNVRVLNRTHERAVELAERCGATAVPLNRMECEVAQADAVFATVGAATPILTQDVLGAVSEAREGAALLIVDMGVPPNVEMGALPTGIDVVDLDRLVAACAANSEIRLSAIPLALEILDHELARFGEALVERAAAPTIKALVQRGENIKRRNVEWAREKLGHLGDKEMRVVEEMARRMMIGLLQAPIEGLKGELSAQEHRHVVERLFALDPSLSNGGSGDR